MLVIPLFRKFLSKGFFLILIFDILWNYEKKIIDRIFFGSE